MMIPYFQEAFTNTPLHLLFGYTTPFRVCQDKFVLNGSITLFSAITTDNRDKTKNLEAKLTQGQFLPLWQPGCPYGTLSFVPQDYSWFAIISR
jgi:hypothetical protein